MHVAPREDVTSSSSLTSDPGGESYSSIMSPPAPRHASTDDCAAPSKARGLFVRSLPAGAKDRSRMSMPSASTAAPSPKSVPAKSSSSFDLGAGPAASGRGSVAGDCARGVTFSS